MKRSYGWWLTATGLAYTVTHHIGSLPNGLGPAGGDTRWADWIDLLTPYVVLLPAAATLVAAEASRRTWTVFVVGCLAYAQGHGIHLSANSIGNIAGDNAATGEVIHLWDEVMGHYVWYAGAALVGASLAVTMAGRPRPPIWAYALSLGVGLTWFTNAVGGGTLVASLIVAAVATWWGIRSRRGLPLVVAVGFVPAAVLLAAELMRTLA